VFFTLSPDPIGPLLTARQLFLLRNNRDFPACDAGFAAAVRAQDDAQFVPEPVLPGAAALPTINVRQPELSAKMAGNAAVASSNFADSITALFLHGLGMEMTQKTRMTHLSNVGVFGRCFGAVSVVETGGRGHCHLHLLAWAGLPAAHAGLLALSDAGRAELAIMRATWSRAELIPHAHLQDLLRRHLKVKTPRAGWIALSDVGEADFAFRGDCLAAQTNAHVPHNSRCCAKGASVCAQGYSKPHCPEAALHDLIARDESFRADPTRSPEEQQQIRVPPSAQPTPVTALDPLGLHSNEMLVHEPARPLLGSVEETLAMVPGGGAGAGGDAGAPLTLEAAMAKFSEFVATGTATSREVLERLVDSLSAEDRAHLERALATRNTRVADFHPYLTAVLGCNTASYTLTNGVSARTVFFYLVNYCTKDNTKLVASLPALLAAVREHNNRFPSVADDAGTASRNATYALTRLMNQQNMLQEMSLEYVLLGLLNFPAEQMTHNFVPCNPWLVLRPYQVEYPDLFTPECDALMAALDARNAEDEALFPEDNAAAAAEDVGADMDL
jgi:hypothetical protein